MAKAKYNYQHQQARRRALAALQDGTPCHFCGRPMTRTMNLHLDHNTAGTAYRGLAHARCNTIDGARRGGQTTARLHGTRRGRHATTTHSTPTTTTWHSQAW